MASRFVVQWFLEICAQIQVTVSLHPKASSCLPLSKSILRLWLQISLRDFNSCHMQNKNPEYLQVTVDPVALAYVKDSVENITCLMLFGFFHRQPGGLPIFFILFFPKRYVFKNIIKISYVRLSVLKTVLKHILKSTIYESSIQERLKHKQFLAVHHLACVTQACVVVPTWRNIGMCTWEW